MLGGMCEMSNISGNKNYYTVHYLPTPWKGVGGGALELLSVGTGVACKGLGGGQQHIYVVYLTGE